MTLESKPRTSTQRKSYHIPFIQYTESDKEISVFDPDLTHMKMRFWIMPLKNTDHRKVLHIDDTSYKILLESTYSLSSGSKEFKAINMDPDPNLEKKADPAYSSSEPLKKCSIFRSTVFFF